MRVYWIYFVFFIVLLGPRNTTARYKMLLITERVEEYFHDPKVLDSVLKTVFVNRTTKGLEGYFMIHNEEDIKPDNMVNIEAFHWINYKYTEFPQLNVRFTWKNILVLKTFGFDEAFSKYYKPKLEWPIKAKVKYIFKDMSLADQPVPIGMPEGRYLVKLSYANPKKVVFMKTGYYFAIKKVLYD